MELRKLVVILCQIMLLLTRTMYAFSNYMMLIRPLPRMSRPAYHSLYLSLQCQDQCRRRRHQSGLALQRRHSARPSPRSETLPAFGRDLSARILGSGEISGIHIFVGTRHVGWRNRGL